MFSVFLCRFPSIDVRALRNTARKVQLVIHQSIETHEGGGDGRVVSDLFRLVHQNAGDINNYIISRMRLIGRCTGQAY